MNEWNNYEVYLEEHELIEWIIPLHEEDAIGSSGTQVAVSIVWILTDAGSQTISRFGNAL